MRVTRSFTIERSTGNYEKVVVSLDEGDLARILTEQIPEVTPLDLTTREAFQVFELEAQIFLLSVSVIRFNYPEPTEGAAQLKKFQVARLNLLQDIKLRVLRDRKSSEDYDAGGHINRYP